ncbi:DUF1294 domain-containing protein [Methanohalophilus halophilus]|uniref:DUF1294 domain-containing protein n=1 Tax=Methanohalophilus halophilus TaxID=2177 RepID=A0A1L3Q1G7_9EURY|nr:DUF1294 domain-containing protein [Methanohalophilus halophilus]APH38631.1 hypothetical protein BHR79_03430 [Methanohalophilus halophilus]RNI08370.1 DUF1294 domain-containing protein [Methanohalophilus halophilus]SDW17642.1 Uncharacterized membrane protein YsdA, DUF1294 family [Methanohalophilus halophilus]
MFPLEHLVLAYIGLASIFSFVIMGIDKRKAVKGAYRLSENFLFTCAFAGGSVGILAGMYIFRHKVRRWKFKLGIPAILILEIYLYVKFI